MRINETLALLHNIYQSTGVKLLLDLYFLSSKLRIERLDKADIVLSLKFFLSTELEFSLEFPEFGLIEFFLYLGGT